MENALSVRSADGFEQQLAKLRDMLRSPLYRRQSQESIKTNDLTPSKKGGQGTVVVGTFTYPPEWEMLEPERRVAVKKLDWKRNDPDATVKLFKSFVYEVKLRAKLNHPNIAFLLGFVENIEKGDAWLISPWETNGNVREFLQSGEWEIPEGIALIQDVSNGVEFLHNQDPPICHGDLKSFNILVNSEHSAVITDFGSARTRPQSEARKEQDQPSTPQAEAIERTVAKFVSSLKATLDENTQTITLTGPGWSLRWTAPEVLDDGMQDLPSDMWALGWICWELLTGKIPFEELNNDGKIILHAIEGRLPNIRENSQLSLVLNLCTMMSDCWLVEPTKRIDATSFSKKVRIMPSTTPEGKSSEGPKARSARLLLELAQMYSLQNDQVNAERHYCEALEAAKRTNDEEAKANALNILGRIYRARANDEEAEKVFLESHAIHSRIGNDLGAANALTGLGQTYLAGSRNSEAEKAFLEAHAIHSGIGHDLGAANALNGLGEAHFYQSRHSEAEKAFLEAYAIHSRIGNDLGAANALGGLGETYLSQSLNGKAEKALLEAHAIHSGIGNDLGAANALLDLGSVHVTELRTTDAEETLLRAHKLYISIGNDRGIARTLLTLALSLHMSGRHSQAAAHCLDALDAYRKIEAHVKQARTLSILGLIYGAQGQHVEAENAVNEALAIYMSIGDDEGQTDSLQLLEHIHASQYTSSPNGSSMEFLLQVTQSLAENGVAVDGPGFITEALADLYAEQGRNSEAEEHYCLAQAIHMSRGDSNGEASALLSLGKLYGRQEQYELAEEHFAQARVAYAIAAAENGEAEALDCLMGMSVLQDKFEAARSYCMDACEIYTRLGRPMSEICGTTLQLVHDLELHSKSSSIISGPLFHSSA